MFFSSRLPVKALRLPLLLPSVLILNVKATSAKITFSLKIIFESFSGKRI